VKVFQEVNNFKILAISLALEEYWEDHTFLFSERNSQNLHTF